MTLTGLGVAALPVTGTTTTTQTGSAIALSNLTITGALSGTYGAANGTLVNNTFTATGAYPSSGCGVITTTWTGYFSADGGLMNLKVVLTPATSAPSSCGVVQFLGEVRR